MKSTVVVEVRKGGLFGRLKSSHLVTVKRKPLNARDIGLETVTFLQRDVSQSQTQRVNAFFKNR